MLQVTAKVTITVEMPASSTWNENCPVDQVYAQAGRETVSRLTSVIKSYGGKVVGEPKVVAVAMER